MLICLFPDPHFSARLRKLTKPVITKVTTITTSINHQTTYLTLTSGNATDLGVAQTDGSFWGGISAILFLIHAI